MSQFSTSESTVLNSELAGRCCGASLNANPARLLARKQRCCHRLRRCHCCHDFLKLRSALILTSPLPSLLLLLNCSKRSGALALRCPQSASELHSSSSSLNCAPDWLGPYLLPHSSSFIHFIHPSPFDLLEQRQLRPQHRIG